MRSVPYFESDADGTRVCVAVDVAAADAEDALRFKDSSDANRLKERKRLFYRDAILSLKAAEVALDNPTVLTEKLAQLDALKAKMVEQAAAKLATDVADTAVLTLPKK